MRKTIFLFVLISIFSFAQNAKIYPKSKIILGEENIFIYEPKKGMKVPEDVYADYISTIGERKSPLKKVNSKYEFTIKLPDSIKTVMMIFKNKNESYVDKNNNNAFSYYLKNTKDGKAIADRLNLMEFANYAFKLNYSDAKLASEFENLLKTNPKLKDYSDTYFRYLNSVNKSNPEKGKELTEKYAKTIEQRGDENSIVNAMYYYRFVNSFDKAEQLSKAILDKYPIGKLAKSKFVDSFFEKISKPDFQLNEIIANQFIADFSKFPKDFYDKYTLDNVRKKLLEKAIDERNWEKIEKSEKEISEKWFSAAAFNENSWKIADGDNINSEGKDLEFAEKLARKAFEIYYNKMKNLDKYDEKSNYDQSFMYYTDALAMILYKQKKYQEAFNEQSKLIHFDFLDDSNRERYVLYAEKVKGNDFVKKYIYSLLKEKSISSNLLDKLSAIYKSQNLSTSEIEKLQADNKKIATKKARQELLKFYGNDLKAKDFSLTNLAGKTVKLSDYKGKIVVLDFWGTWCSPCRASLPHMQELVNQYKGKDVEFFFVDVRENKKPEEVKKVVTKFISDNKYTLNVLFDFDDKVAKSFKIQGVPCEIIIDKEGNIISRSEGYDGNLGALIAENL